MADHAKQNTQPPQNPLSGRAADLFRHISTEKAPLYRAIMDVFATAKRQYRLQLRPDEVLAAGDWGGTPPTLEDLTTALGQLASWGNLDAQPDTARVQTLEDFYRARFLYQLSQGGEAVEAAVETFTRTLHRRAELQTIALEDIAGQLEAMQTLLEAEPMDVAKVHQNLRDLTRVFEGPAENAQAFMAGMARGVDLRQADATAIAAQKHRLIEYLERFIGDLVRRSGSIGSQILALEPLMAAALNAVAGREAVDAAPGDDREAADERVRRFDLWHERWPGQRRRFASYGPSTIASGVRATAQDHRLHPDTARAESLVSSRYHLVRRPWLRSTCFVLSRTFPPSQRPFTHALHMGTITKIRAHGSH